jgi:hypothetical protein
MGYLIAVPMAYRLFSQQITQELPKVLRDSSLREIPSAAAPSPKKTAGDIVFLLLLEAKAIPTASGK